MLTNIFENRGRDFTALVKLGDMLGRSLRENVEIFSVEGNKVTYDFVIPANTSAQLRLLIPKGAKITEGGKIVKYAMSAKGYQSELGSGNYHWVVE